MGDLLFLRVAAAELALKRKLSLPVSKMWRRWVRRAVVILASPKTVAHSLKLRLVVTTTYNRFNRWSHRGLWGRIFATLAAQMELPDD